MTDHHVIVLGAGAAGLAATAALTRAENVRVTLVAHTGETPSIRMHITGVAFGPTLPHTIHAPLPAVPLLDDTAVHIDAAARTVTLSSGTLLRYDTLLIATGSHPRALDPHTPGVGHPAVVQRVTTLHSLDDAEKIRERLQHAGTPTRVAIYGGGFTGAEVASSLRDRGHHVALISRARIPGQSAFGPTLAARIAATHRARITSFPGRTIAALHPREDSVGIILDDTTLLSADLLIVALGTDPTGPSPFTRGVDVDDRHRARIAHIYAAGAAATHHDHHLGTWHIDHWADAAAQGAHAAAALLHDHTGQPDPGPYRPRSAYGALIHGTAISGIGYTPTAEERSLPGPDLVIEHTLHGALVGVVAVDAVTAAYQRAERLHGVLT